MAEKKKYPIGSENYTLYEEIGQGVSASVHRALCIPFNEIVAIKILDFERDNCDLNNIFREAQTMILVDHPNVLKSHCSFVSDHNLWVVMPYMAGGSCLHILKAAHPDGFEEVVIATVLRDVLKGLEYLHHHGHIHRDVKAGNILVDSRGAVKLGDFGVSACLFDSGDRQRVRNTFVGTPCWMAPEVMEQLHGYDFKADIWSFGITALELAHGHAPFSKYPPMKVLLMTLQNAPPGLDYERDQKFSKSFKQMIASCLVKDPLKRPSAKKLLKHPFFKQARSNDYIVRTLIDKLPAALGDRLKALKRKDKDMLAQKRIPDGEMEEMSQNEYKRGISGWNFDLEDVKAQASLIQDELIFLPEKDQSDNSSVASGQDSERYLPHHSSSASHTSQVSDDVNDLVHKLSRLSADSTETNTLIKGQKSDDDASVASSILDHQFSQCSTPRSEDYPQKNLDTKPDSEVNGRMYEHAAAPAHQRSGSLSARRVSLEAISLPSKGESDKLQNPLQRSPRSNGIHVLQTVNEAPAEPLPRASKTSASSDELSEMVKPVVQQKGRFKILSENLDLEKVVPSPSLHKSHSMQAISQLSGIPSPSPSSSIPSPAVSGSSILLVLQSLLQTNMVQKETILGLMKQAYHGDSTANRNGDGGGTLPSPRGSEKSTSGTGFEREKKLLHDLTELQSKLLRALEELQKLKIENSHNSQV